MMTQICVTETPFFRWFCKFNFAQKGHEPTDGVMSFLCEIKFKTKSVPVTQKWGRDLIQDLDQDLAQQDWINWKVSWSQISVTPPPPM